jgi:predicted regulator of Ras-like GTPase activity (Roadblock/LC7/MglB family)/ribosomal protein L40E
MIICQNCGTTNNEASSQICRKCGALLPVSSKRARSRSFKSTRQKKKEQEKKIEQTLKESIELEASIENKRELVEIPEEIELHEIPTPSEESDSDIPPEKESTSDLSNSEVLQEITPQPYKGSIINSHDRVKSPSSLPTPPSKSRFVISDAFRELKSSVLEDEKEKSRIPLSPIPLETTESDNSVLKQKKLEKDMVEVLGFLSKKISVKKLVDPTKKKEPDEQIPPTSMNEILKRLLSLDLNIEASSIIKTDGTILASAISSRISDSLFATIGMNLSMIGTDIIEGLDAGTLKSISVRGTDGVLDLAPIDRENPSVKDMILVIFSHPKVKSGIISFAVNIVKKQLLDYLG